MTGFRWIEGVGGEVVADGKRLEAVAYGPPPEKAPTIVMLHEGLGCVALWRDFPAKLAAATGWGVFAYSRAGYGRSDPVDLPRPLDYMTREARFSLPTVLDAIRFQRGILLGHSDGASIAAIYAGERFDGRVKGLVLMAPTSSPRSRASPRSRRRDGPMRRATCARSSPNITPMSTALFAAGTAPGSIRGSRPGTSRIRRPLARPGASDPGRGRSVWNAGANPRDRSAGRRRPSRASSSTPAAIRRRSISRRRRSTRSSGSAPRSRGRRRREARRNRGRCPRADEAIAHEAAGSALPVQSVQAKRSPTK